MYCNLDDLKKLFTEKELIELTSDTDELSQDVLDECITAADAEINTYLRKVYSELPPDPVPDIVKKLSVDLTVYVLHDRRDAVSDRMENKRKNAIQLLDRISKKSVSVGAQTETQKPKTILMRSKTRQFYRQGSYQELDD